MNKKTKICLNAMVANESRTILRMLESCYKYIDYWVIQDNGSKDNTKELINDFFREKGIPGFLYETEWKFPGFNRNHTLQECLKSNHGCDWILRMDADEELRVEDDFDWSILEDTNVASYHMVADAGDTKYLRTWLWNSKLPWFFQNDKRHETIHLPDVGEDFERKILPFGFRHIVSSDGQTWSVPRKFLKDALELEIDKIVEDKINGDYYHLWYIAKSYSDCYGDHNQYFFGRKHSEEFARRAIFYFERFLNLMYGWDNSTDVNKEDEMGYFALICIANANIYLGNMEKAIESYYLAEQFSPMRNEHLIYLAELLENLGLLEDVLNVITKMMLPERVNPFPHKAFLIEDRAYHNTSNFLMEYKIRIQNKINNPIVELKSVKFEF